MKFEYCNPSRLFPTTEDAFGVTGFTIMHVFPVDNPLPNFISTVCIGMLLLLYAAWTLKPAVFAPTFGGSVPTGPMSTLRTALFLYLAITGVFFAALVTQLNKVVIVMAALHNWCEWLVLAHVFVDTSGAQEKFRRLLSLWIWVVMFGILLIPDMIQAFAFEQLFGLWPDFMLLIAAHYLASEFKDAETQTMTFVYFRRAASFHICQIFTLIVLGAGLLPAWPVAQGILAFTSFFNYGYYAKMAIEFDAWNSGETAASERKRSAPSRGENGHGEQLSDMEKGGSKTLTNVDGKKARWFDSRPTKLIFAGICFALSAFVIGGGLNLLPYCVKVKESKLPDVRVTRYALQPNAPDIRSTLLRDVRSKRDQADNIVARLYVGKSKKSKTSYTVYEWWNGTVPARAPLKVKGAKMKSWTSQSLAKKGGASYIPPETDVLPAKKGTVICEAKEDSGLTFLRAGKKHGDAMAIKLAGNTDSWRQSLHLYVASREGQDRDFMLFESWEGTGWSWGNPLTRSLLAKPPVSSSFREIDTFSHCAHAPESTV